MPSKKEYAEPEKYEVKLEKVMTRLNVDRYDYDWSRHKCWVEFYYKNCAEKTHGFNRGMKGADKNFSH